MRIKVGDHISEEFEINAGVPQGAIGSPLLYKLFTYDLPELEEEEEDGANFADDLSEWVRAHTIEEIARLLTKILVEIDKWSRRWRLRIAANKSACMVITRNREMMRGQLNLKLNGEAIPQVKTLKLLGVTLDAYGSWTNE